MGVFRRMGATITRGKVAAAKVAARTILQLTGLANETPAGIELILPPGYVAVPLALADILIVPILGTRNHQVALGGDSTADTVRNLAPGESGLSQTGVRRVILRNGYIEIVDPVKIVLNAPQVVWTPDNGETFRTLATDLHNHETPDGPTTAPLAGDAVLT